MQHRRGQDRVALSHARIGRQIAVADGGADPQATPVGVFDPAMISQAADVDEGPRPLDPEPHQVHEVGPATEEPSLGLGGEQRHRVLSVAGALVAERSHEDASAIAGTMFAYVR